MPVNVKRQGGPVAAHGLNVRTKRPKLTPFEEMQFGKLSIVVRLSFNRDGRPLRVEIARFDEKRRKNIWQPAEGATGYEGRIVTSLFRWRASGKELDALKGDKTVSRVFELMYR